MTDEAKALVERCNGHTPGPWTYESDHTHRQFNIRMLGHHIGTKDEAKHICTINNLPAHVLANRDPKIAEANAHLIAAAPNLLDLIETQAREIERLRDTPHRIWAEARDSEWDEGFNYAVKLFRAALAGDSHDQ